MNTKNNNYFLKTPDGKTLRYQYWPSTSHPAKAKILLLQGRGTPLEKFDHIIPTLQENGYEIWGFDWRGQGLSTRDSGKRSHIKRYKLYIDDLDFFLKTFFAEKNTHIPLLALGQSMGGHIGLRYMAEKPGFIDGAVMTAPMLDLYSGVYSKSFALWASRLIVHLGLGKSYIYSAKQYDPSTLPFEGNNLTYNREIFYYHRHLLIENPELISKGVTFGWIRSSFHSIKKLNCQKKLSCIEVPIKIYVAAEDSVVDNSPLEKITQWIPNCDTEIIENARHLLLFEEQNIITRILKGLDDFVKENYPNSYYNNLYNKIKQQNKLVITKSKTHINQHVIKQTFNS